MQRFQKYLGRRVEAHRIKDPALLSSTGVSQRYVPEEIDDFDEMEFGAGRWEGRDVIFTLVIENGSVARISLGYIPAGGSEDDMAAFTDSQLQALLDARGDALGQFFESVLVE
jgi:hypothetical protein